MTVEMGFKMIIFLCVLLAITNATEVDLSSAWKPDVGWTVECSWKLFSNDSLQSVRHYNNGQQFMIYRPEKHGPKHMETFRLPDSELLVDCIQTVEKGLLGNCLLTLYLNKAPTEDFNYTCEVSGERPTFRIERKDISVAAFVAPSEALINVVTLAEQSSGQVKLRCKSTGIPAPNLAWRVGDQRVPQDFSDRSWNTTTKLWDVWSEFSFTPSEHVTTCAPEVSRGGQLIKGREAVYSSGSLPGVNNIIIAVLALLILSR